MVKKFNCINISNPSISFKDKKVIIWGRSASGLSLYIQLKSEGADVLGFTDSFAVNKGEIFAELPVYTLDMLKEEKDTYYYISTANSDNMRSILELAEKLQLDGNRIICKYFVYGAGEYCTEEMAKCIEKDKDKIAAVRGVLSDELSVKTFDNLLKYRTTNDTQLIKEVYCRESQYFPKSDMFSPSENEVFVDAGVYLGESSVEFARWTNNSYEKIYMLEPDKTLYPVSKQYVEMFKLKNYEVHKIAAYSCSTTLSFNQDFLSGSSSIKESGAETVEAAAIDDILNGKKATYIKMDIEGAELDALEGCVKTITKYHPRLAVCVYHKHEDLWTLPYYILSNYPFYKFYLRHYTPFTTETVLYAVEK